MKRFMLYSLMVVVFFLSGCVMRVASLEVDRVDQKIKGNRGIIFGKVPALVEKERRKTRTIYDVEIELGSPADIEIQRTEDGPSQEGNKGYIQRKDVFEKTQAPVRTQRSPLTQGVPPYSARPQVIYQKPAVDTLKKEGTGEIRESSGKESAIPETYMVEKGDTLQKISKKFYGTTRQWKKIYEANKELSKSPDKIRAGQIVNIPQL